jgi:hypothetical protein
MARFQAGIIFSADYLCLLVTQEYLSLDGGLHHGSKVWKYGLDLSGSE